MIKREKNYKKMTPQDWKLCSMLGIELQLHMHSTLSPVREQLSHRLHVHWFKCCSRITISLSTQYLYLSSLYYSTTWKKKFQKFSICPGIYYLIAQFCMCYLHVIWFSQSPQSVCSVISAYTTSCHLSIPACCYVQIPPKRGKEPR